MNKGKVLMYEVDNLADFNIKKEGLRRFDCIGGSKNFQVFLAPSEWSRSDFMNNYREYLDEAVKPVYEDEDVVVSQDVRYAVPGFYIVSTKSRQRTIVEMDFKLYKKCIALTHHIGSLIKTITGNNCFYYYEEHLKKPASTHFWVLPIYENIVQEKGFDLTICKCDIWKYVDCFSYSQVKAQIYNLNNFIKKSLSEVKNENR